MDFRLFWLALGAFAIGAEGFVISSLLPQVSTDTGVSVVQGGYLVLAFALAYALGAPVLASLTGHRDRRQTLTASMLTFTAGNVVAGLAHSYEQLLLARIVMALAAGLFTATAQATAVAISEPHHRARAISVIVGGTTVAVAFGAPLGALIADYAGWRGTFWTIAGVSAASAIAIRTMLPAGLTGPRLPLRDRLAIVARPGVVPVLLTTLLIGNMTCNIIVFVISAQLLGRVEHALRPAEGGAGWWQRVVVALLLAVPPLMVTYAADVFPKVIGTLNNTRIAPLIALPVATLLRLLWPVNTFIDGFGNRLARILAPAGKLRLFYDNVAIDSGEPEPSIEGAYLHPVEELPPEAERRFQRLRSARLRLAREKQLPPYVICHDRTLKLIALQAPADERGLEQVKGMGPNKVRLYGEALLGALREEGDGTVERTVERVVEDDMPF